MKIKIFNNEKLFEVTDEHLWTFFYLQEMYNLDPESIFEIPDYITEEDLLDALNSRNGQAKTFPGLYVQDFLEGNLGDKFQIKILTFVSPSSSSEIDDKSFKFIEYTHNQIISDVSHQFMTIDLDYNQASILLVQNHTSLEEENNLLEWSNLKYNLNDIVITNFSSHCVIETPVIRKITFTNILLINVYPIDDRSFYFMNMCGENSTLANVVYNSIEKHLRFNYKELDYPDQSFYDLINNNTFQQKFNIVKDSLKKEQYIEGDENNQPWKAKTIRGLLLQEARRMKFDHKIVISVKSVLSEKVYSMKNDYCTVKIRYPNNTSIADISDNFETSEINLELNVNCLLIKIDRNVSNVRCIKGNCDIIFMNANTHSYICKLYPVIPFIDQTLIKDENFSIPYIEKDVLEMLRKTSLIPFKIYTIETLIKNLNGMNHLIYFDGNKKKIEDYINILRSFNLEKDKASLLNKNYMLPNFFNKKFLE